jgi:hypothetical protein
VDLFERLSKNNVLRAAITARRALRGPKRSSWTLEMEIVAEFMRLYGPVSMRLSPQLQRMGGNAVLQPSALAQRTKRENTKVGELPAEWFIPHTTTQCSTTCMAAATSLARFTRTRT